MKNYGIVLQARSSSKRFPRKIYKQIDKKSTLEILLERIKKIKSLKIIVATTNYSKDDYSQFNKIIKTENQEKNQFEAKNKKVKVIDYNKLNESNKKIKNKVGIEKIKIVYFD